MLKIVSERVVALALQAIRVAVAGPPRHFIESWEREAKLLVHERFAEQTDEFSVSFKYY